MNKEQSKILAQQLLDSEFEEANHNPIEYCVSMGWNSNSDATNRAKNKKGKLAPSAEDIKILASIIECTDLEDSIEIKENNVVSDYMCNCVAIHILS